MHNTKAILAGILIAATATCASAQDLVMYSANPMPVTEKVQELTKAAVGSNLSIVTGSSGVLLRRIEAEGGAPAGDLFWSSSANTMEVFEKFFEPYSSPELESVSAEFRYPGDGFMPSSVNVVTVMINTDQLDGLPKPTSWADLTDPAWKGKIIMSNPESGSTGYTIIWGLSKLLDAETYNKVIANTVVTESSSGVPKAVASGEYAAGFTYETNPYNYIEGGQSEIEIVYPSEGTFTTVEYAGLVKNAPGGELAKKAIDTLLSKDTQIELLKTGFRRPTRGDIHVADYLKLPELADIKVFKVDEREAAAAREAFLAEWRSLPKGGN